MLALADVPVAERGAAQHVDRPGLGAVGLAAPVPFHDLRLLVLGEHALELHQQLVLGRVSARALDELNPRAGPGEFLDQQRLVGELAGQPVRGVAQHHVDPDPGDQVPQPFQGRADQCGAGVALVVEHPLLGNLKPRCSACSRSAAVCDADRLVLLLPGRGDPGVDRRAGHAAVVLPDRPARCGPAAGAPEWRRPPTNPWPRGGRRRTRVSTTRSFTGGGAFCGPAPGIRSTPAPPGRRSCSPTASARSRTRATSAAGSLTVNTRCLRHLRRPSLSGALGIPARLPRRAAEPMRQNTRGLGHRHPATRATRPPR